MNTHQPIKKWIHHYLKAQSIETLLTAINSDRTKPKHKVKYVNEMARRKVALVWK